MACGVLECGDDGDDGCIDFWFVRVCIFRCVWFCEWLPTLQIRNAIMARLCGMSDSNYKYWCI